MKKISIIIPAYNEEKTIAEVVKKVFSVNISGYQKEVIVVNDCSADDTGNILGKLKKSHGSMLVATHLHNQGKGAAIRTGIGLATGQIAIIQDADSEYNPLEIAKLVEVYDSHPREVVYGSRNLSIKNGYSYLSYLLGNKFLNFATNLLFRLNITDMETCYKLLPLKLFKKIDLQSDGFDMEPEITAKVSLMKYKIHETPITYNPRSKKEGKKIRWVDGLIALKVLISLRFFGRYKKRFVNSID